MSAIKKQLEQEIKESLKAKDKKKLAALRMFSAAIKQYEVDTRTEPTDNHVIKIFTKLLKQRREALEQFKKANRQDLAEQEQYEIELISTFMPKPLSEEELDTLIDKTIAATNAKNIKDMRNVLSSISKEVFGKADMSIVSSMIKEKLQNKS